MEKTSASKGGINKAKIVYSVPDLSAFLFHIFIKVNGINIPIKKQGGASEEAKSRKYIQNLLTIMFRFHTPQTCSE
jgi:hypothetical protein